MKAFTYILRCADGTFYTGWTTDLKKRLDDHNSPDRGAKYTRGRRPVTLVWYEEFEDRRDAMKREWEIKNRYDRRAKEELVRSAGKVNF